jgi:GT2 family glycosyltransferase
VKKLAIVLLNWNGKKWLEQFLPNIIAFSNQHDIIVADNASSDDSIAFLKTNYPQITIIKNNTNGGFAKGYNDALTVIEGKYEYYGIVNSDIEVTENWLTPLIQKLDESPTIGAVQPKIKSFNQKNKFEHAGAAGGFIDRNYYPFCRGRIFDSVEEDTGQYDNEKEVFWTSGACMLIRSSIFHQLNGFDADFFAHMEEIDLCWRMKLQGFSLFCVPSSTVFHVGGGTLPYNNPKKTYLNFRNNLFMIHKNHQGVLFTKILYRLILDGLAGLKFALGFQFSHLFALLKAHISYYKSLSYLNKKRKLIQTTIQQVNNVGSYRANILYSHFFKKIYTFDGLNKRYFVKSKPHQHF